MEVCLLEESLFKAKLEQLFSYMLHKECFKSRPYLILEGWAQRVRFVCLLEIQTMAFQMVNDNLVF